ncbi:hypothetical protein GCM10027568_04040 [Humibacter soli]
MATTRRTGARAGSPNAQSPEVPAEAGAPEAKEPLSQLFSDGQDDVDVAAGDTDAQAASPSASDVLAPDPSSEPRAASAPAPAPRPQPQPQQPLTETQLLNDPLLGTHDDIIVDLGVKLRWAAVGYALLGVIASWIIAAQVAIATKDAGAFGWALAATILIFAGAVWYFADVSSRFASVAAYRKAKTPQSVARLNRGGVVGLYGVVGAWIGAALGVLVLVSGTTTAVLTIAAGASGWAWFFGGIPVVLLYLFGFGLMHYRVIEKARDAVA